MKRTVGFPDGGIRKVIIFKGAFPHLNMLLNNLHRKLTCNIFSDLNISFVAESNSTDFSFIRVYVYAIGPILFQSSGHYKLHRLQWVKYVSHRPNPKRHYLYY